MCIFCDIINGKIPSYKIYEDDYTYAFLDISNDANGHTLVIPKKHCENLLDVDVDTLNNVVKTIQKVSKHYVNNCGAKGVNILNANGKEAEQTVFHLHFHILPRFENDGFTVFPNLEKNKESLDKIQEKLKLN